MAASPETKAAYKRVLVKLSGEALMGDDAYGINSEKVADIAAQVSQLRRDSDVEVCLVLGGGNIFRGVSAAAQGMERASADYMGMLATVINALAVQDGLERVGAQTRVLSALPIQSVCEPYIRRRAVRHLAVPLVLIEVSKSYKIIRLIKHNHINHQKALNIT